MHNIVKCNLLIIGAGPAGLAAALEADKLGIKDIVLIERNNELGGILEQCIHDGFGLQRFKKQLSGPEYAQRFIDEVLKTKIKIKLKTMVVDIDKDKNVIAINSIDGLVEYRPNAIIFAMGCRERTRNQVFIYGSRPKGVFTAGTVQRYINIEGYKPGKKAVILGSGDIGLIMARRMKLEGIEVEGVYEIMSRPGGLNRNIYQCLRDYDIPLYLSTTVSKIHGKYQVEGVSVQQIDKDRNLIPGTERYIECDMLILSVGLIPENELSNKAQVKLSKSTRGPILDSNMMTEVDGIFAAGNVCNVFDLVDYVSNTGEIAARGVKAYLDGTLKSDHKIDIIEGDSVRFLLPQKYVRSEGADLEIYFRAAKEIFNAEVTLSDEKGNILYKKKHQVVRPQEMVREKIAYKMLESADKIIVSCKEI